MDTDVCICYSLILWRLIAPSARHKPFHTGSLFRCSNDVAFRLCSRPVVHGDGGNDGVDFVLIESLSDLVDIVVVDGKGWSRGVSFGNLETISGMLWNG
jgi:hypothetical protein